MLPLIASLFAFSFTYQATSLRLYSIPTSEEVRVAAMAARDEGYNTNLDGTFLDEIHAPSERSSLPGYQTIELYSDGNLIHSYSIRTQTGDIVDARTCQAFEYPDLLKFKKKLMSTFGTGPVSLTQIADEVGCDKMDVLRAPQNAGKVRGPVSKSAPIRSRM